MWNPNESMFAGCVVLKAQDGLSPSSRRPRSRQRGRPLLSSQAAQPFLIPYRASGTPTRPATRKPTAAKASPVLTALAVL